MLRTLLLSLLVCPWAAAQSDDWMSRELRECTSDMLPSAAGVWNSNLWPGGVVPFEFNANVSASQADAMLAAMAQIELVSGVDFVPRAGQTSALHIQDSTGNNSFVGRVGGLQTINIFNWNFRQIMAHELMHALGVWHEQSRPDRDTFVSINYDNICQTCCSGNPCDGNFNIRNGSLTGSYDFDSVMHYSGTAFSSNGGLTIVAQPPYARFQSLMGQRNHLSHWDVGGLAARYGGNPSGLRFSAQPVSRTGTQGGAVVLSVSTAGPAPLFHRWRRNGIAISDQPGRVSGATTTSLQISQLTAADAGTYDVVLSLAAWSSSSRLVTAIASAPAELTVFCPADLNLDGNVDGDDVILFFGAWDNALPEGDFSDDGSVDGDDVIAFFARWDANC